MVNGAPPSRTPPRSSGSSAAARSTARVACQAGREYERCRTLAMGMPYWGDLCQVRFIAAQRLEPQREFILVANTLADLTKPECRFAHHRTRGFGRRLGGPTRRLASYFSARAPAASFSTGRVGRVCEWLNCWVRALGCQPGGMLRGQLASGWPPADQHAAIPP